MTPSRPTFSTASASRLPIVASLLAEIVPTWAISSFFETGRDMVASSATAASTAFSIPRRTAVGLAPVVTVRRPSRKIARARMVAVVVPSPAVSEVFDATTLTSLAPMFSNGSGSSISLETVTPSLVTVGPPNDFERITFRPVGPERGPDGVGQDVDAFEHLPAGGVGEQQLLGHESGLLDEKTQTGHG